MPVQVSCNQCGASFRAKDELAGKRVKCPGCGGPVAVQRAGGAYDFDDYEDADDYSSPATKECPYCAERIKATSRVCPHCDSDLTEAPAGSRRGKKKGDRAKQESRDKSDAIAIFVTGLIGCFAPIVAIFGIVFLVKRPYSFPCKGLAIAGTILHWIWTVLLVLRFTVLRGAF